MNQDLCSISDCNNRNGLQFNEDKCRVMVFGKRLVDNNIILKINDIELDYTDNIKDLGIIFDNKLTFRDHIFSIISKAKKSLWLIKYYTKNFNNINAIIQLYNSIVKSILMFGSVVWTTNNKELIYEIEKVQNDFLGYISYKMHISYNYFQHDYTDILGILEMSSLFDSRNTHDLLFIYKLFNNKLNLSNIKSQFEEYKPKKNLRNRELIFSIHKKYINKKHTKIKNKSTIYRLSVKVNRYAKWINIKAQSFGIFKKAVKDNINEI